MPIQFIALVRRTVWFALCLGAIASAGCSLFRPVPKEPPPPVVKALPPPKPELP
jgi:hypothetical protein